MLQISFKGDLAFCMCGFGGCFWRPKDYNCEVEDVNEVCPAPNYKNWPTDMALS